MAAPFPEASIAPIVYLVMGSLSTLVVVLGVYSWNLRNQLKNMDVETETDNGPDLRIDNIGLSKRAEDLLEQVMEQSELQNELPDRLGVSKATVSQAVSELKERRLVKRKKKANTYLIEPDIEQIKSVQR